MELNEVLQHIRDGSATEEEKEYAKQELTWLANFVDDEARMTQAPIAEPDKSEVKKAKKSFKWRYIFIPLTVIVASILIVGIILSGVFGFAASSAKKSIAINRSACMVLAQEAAEEATLNHPMVRRWVSRGEILGDNYVSSGQTEVDHRKFNYDGANLADSYYSYIIDVDVFVDRGYKPAEFEVKVSVDTRTGNCVIIKCEYDD